MRILGRLVAWASVAAVVWGFFLPWAYLRLHEPRALQRISRTADGTPLLGDLTKTLGQVTLEVRRGAETITGALPSLADLPNQVTGFEIPKVANQRDAKIAMALLEVFTNTRQDLGAQSYAVYAVPGLALLGGVLLTVFGRYTLVALGVALAAAAVAGVGCRQLQTTNTDTLFVAITIGEGIWLSLWAYAGLALGALLVLIGSHRRHRS